MPVRVIRAQPPQPVESARLIAATHEGTHCTISDKGPSKRAFFNGDWVEWDAVREFAEALIELCDQRRGDSPDTEGLNE